MTKPFLSALTLALAATVSWSAETSIPICCNKDAFTPLTPVPLSGAEMKATRAMDPAAAGPKVAVTFAKTGEERRFLALETTPLKPLAPYKAMELAFSTEASEGVSLMPAVMFYEKDGGVWYRSGRPAANAADKTVRLSLAGMRQAAFSTNAGEDVAWDKVDRIWFGFLADGKGQGTFAITKIVLTSEPYRPTEAVSVFLPDVSRWSASADPAVKKELSLAKDEEGRPVLRNAFTFPGGRHMYLTPSQPLPEIEVGAYEGLRFTYKAKVPKGIDTLLVMLNEGGGQFVATPAPPASGDWQTAVCPLRRLQAGRLEQAQGHEARPGRHQQHCLRRPRHGRRQGRRWRSPPARHRTGAHRPQAVAGADRHGASDPAPSRMGRPDRPAEGRRPVPAKRPCPSTTTAAAAPGSRTATPGHATWRSIAPGNRACPSARSARPLSGSWSVSPRRACTPNGGSSASISPARPSSTSMIRASASSSPVWRSSA